MKTTIQIDKNMAVSIENRATGEVRVTIEAPWMSPHVGVSPEKAQDFAEALRQAAAAAIASRGQS